MRIHSPADWCQNCGFRVNSVKLRTVIVQDIQNNIRYEPHWESTNEGGAHVSNTEEMNSTRHLNWQTLN